jgi:hypothetical protein
VARGLYQPQRQRAGYPATRAYLPNNLVPIFQIIVMVFRIVGVEIRLRGVDRDLSQETNPSEFMKRVDVSIAFAK